MKRACFLTFDDTLVTTLSGRQYSLHGEDWKFINQTVEAIKYYVSQGYLICIIINQSSISRGIVSERVFNRKLELVLETLERDIKLKTNTIKTALSIEPHSYRHIPNPGMVYELAVDFEIDVANSVLLGSSSFDRELLNSTNIKTYVDIVSLNDAGL